MSDWFDSKKSDTPDAPSADMLLSQAIDKSWAIIEFSPDGQILRANELFASTMGYLASELVGMRHAILCEESFSASPEYRALWTNLRAGRASSGLIKRKRKDGSPAWLEASYMPIIGAGGAVVKVVKIAADATGRVAEDLKRKAISEALGRSMASVEFKLDGTIVSCNELFAATMGYRQAEMPGMKHAQLCPSEFSSSPEYEGFWKSLRSGKFMAGRFRRIGLGGKEVWLEASYSPI